MDKVKKLYKYCIVPSCRNTTVTAPEKMYFQMPRDANVRKKWCEAVKRVHGSNKSQLFCCEDHFNVENDMENYIKYKLVGGLLKLKKGTLPHKLISQNEEEDNEKLVTEAEMSTDVLEQETQSEQLCCGCLKRGDEIALKEFNIQCEPLKDILKVDSIILCYVCKEIARKAEYFIQNVRNSQILLQNYEGDIPEIKQCFPPTTLTQNTLPSVELPGDGEEESCTVVGGEVKVEPMEYAHDYEEIFIKEEDTSHYLQLTEEVTPEEDSCNQNTPETEWNGKRKVMNVITPRRRKIMAMSRSIGSNEAEYTIERVSEKQCMKEREQRSQDSNYLSCTYRCEDCIKGYMNKNSFDMHMKLHSLSRGDFPCEICMQRFSTTKKMAQHKKCHTYRYKCTKCDVIRVSHSSITHHYSTKHTTFGPCLHQCLKCPKVFKNKVSLRNHEAVHSDRERVSCDACQLTFVSTDTLRKHIQTKHPADGISRSFRKRHVCQQCGMAFQVLYQLKNHLARHSENRPYYCVECDRSFKTELLLTRHLKTASRHVFNADLRVSCDQCEKRFNCRRDLERHVNGAHLKLRPHACDKCDRAYLNSWSLREHKMYIHEGYRKDLRYPCTLCDKVFHVSI